LARLDPTQAQSLPAIPGVTAANAVKLDAPEELKRLPGVSAERPIAPVTAAGVALAKLVLAIVTGSIFILIVYLFIVDLSQGSQISQIYSQILRQAGLGAEYSDPDSIEKVIAVIRQGIENPDAIAMDADQQSERSLEDTLLRFKMLTAEQQSVLGKCVPFPRGIDRTSILKSCVDLLGLEERAARGAAANIDKLKLIIEFSKDVDARHQGLYSFWIQMAQLILLNLLLPLLTGLFGYIFGTQQGNKANDPAV
jgi:hypothetical protein